MIGARGRFGVGMGVVVGVCAAMGPGAMAQPSTVTGHLTADNHFAVFSGTLTNVGSFHVLGSGPSLTGTPINISTYNDFLYIAAWGDFVSLQGFLGELTINGKRITTADPYWFVYATGDDRHDAEDVPSVPDMNVQLALANVSGGDPATSSVGWQIPAVGGLNNGTFPPTYPGPWGTAANIGTDARWIWWDSGDQVSGAAIPFQGPFNHREYLIFRISLGYGSKCPGDQNGDGAVDSADLTLLLGGWGACPTGGGPPPQ